MALRDFLHTLNRQVALGAKRTSKGGQPWMDQLRLNQTRQWLWPGVKATPSASEVLRLQSSSRSGRRRGCIGCVSRGSKLWISGIGNSVDPAVEASIAATRFLSHCLSDSRLLPMYSERTSVRKPPKYQSTHPTRNSTYRTNFTPAVFPCHQTSSQGRHRVPAMSKANSKWVGIAASPETTILAPFE